MKAKPAGRLLGYMARDQYGNTVHGLEKPRRDLLAHCGRKHAERMWRDTKSGDTVHVGYIIAGRWFDVFAVHAWEGGRA